MSSVWLVSGGKGKAVGATCAFHVCNNDALAFYDVLSDRDLGLVRAERRRFPSLHCQRLHRLPEDIIITILNVSFSNNAHIYLQLRRVLRLLELSRPGSIGAIL